MSYAAISIFAVGFLFSGTRCLHIFGGPAKEGISSTHLGLKPCGNPNWAWIFEWGSGLSTALVGNILATQVAFGGLLLVFRDTIRLTIILGPYLLMALLLVVWSSTSVAEVSL